MPLEYTKVKLFKEQLSQYNDVAKLWLLANIEIIITKPYNSCRFTFYNNFKAINDTKNGRPHCGVLIKTGLNTICFGFHAYKSVNCVTLLGSRLKGAPMTGIKPSALGSYKNLANVNERILIWLTLLYLTDYLLSSLQTN